MPEKDGTLTEDEKQTAIRWLKEHLAEQPCPACRHNQWSLGDKVGLFSISSNVFAIGAGYPCVVVICTRCLYMRPHNAIGMGIVVVEEKKKEGTNG